MWESLEQMAWVKTLSTTGWMYATVSVTHYLTMFWCVGSMALVDLRVLGLAARRQNVAELAENLFPWAWTGFALAVVSGFLMFLTDAGDWAPNWVFHLKLTLLILAVIGAIMVQKGAPRWDQMSEIPTSAKIIAGVALFLWVLTILCASEIPNLEGLG